MRTLLLDAGNTRLKWGVLEDGEIVETDHVSMADIHDAGLSVLTKRLPRDVGFAYVSNVAGQSFATRLTGVLSAHCGCDLGFAKTAREACGVSNAYPDPRQMGVDRWAALIGAWREFRSAVLVVDAGTAVTLDALDSKGKHLGGQIVPGFALMAGALSRDTSDIPVVDGGAVEELQRDVSIFADSTAGCVSHGAANAVAGAIERAISVLRSSAYDPALVLTGGDASRILQAVNITPHHRPELVLAGLAELLAQERAGLTAAGGAQ
ncbi:MAG: type III pantothenate kinase [Pseudomonadota bacterium]